MTNDEYKQHFAVQLKYVVNELGPTAAGPADVENFDHFPGKIIAFLHLNHRLSGETGRMSWRF